MALGVEGGGNETHGFPAKAIIFAAINFLLLAVILGYFLRIPIKEFFASRGALIKKDIEDSQAVVDQAEQKYREYEKRLGSIEEEMQALITQLKRDGTLEKDRIVEAAKAQMQALHETSERVMSTELRRAKEELKEEAVQLATQLAEELVRKNITPEDQQRLVKNYMEKMEHLS